ncbi:MAG: hypothetical protein CL608_28140 [Anaerolineaceae bacterium]|nr:hypothetical protein [Anaerolineaceae bacterium]
MTEPIHVRARKFLQEFFNDEDLTNFCFDYFPQVYNDFTMGMPKSQKVRMLVENSQQRGRFDELLAALERERPKSYPDHFAEEPQQIDPKPGPVETIERNPRQIFISHASQDAEFAQKLANDLRANGWQTWMAPDNIRPGEKWVEAINRGLSESGGFVLVLTPSAVESRWVQSEMNVAIGMEHRGDLKLLPLNVKPTVTPALWGAYQWIAFDNSYEAGLSALLGELEPHKMVGPVSTGIIYTGAQDKQEYSKEPDLIIDDTEAAAISLLRERESDPKSPHTIYEKIKTMPKQLLYGSGGFVLLIILLVTFWPEPNADPIIELTETATEVENETKEPEVENTPRPTENMTPTSVFSPTTTVTILPSATATSSRTPSPTPENAQVRGCIITSLLFIWTDEQIEANDCGQFATIAIEGGQEVIVLEDSPVTVNGPDSGCQMNSYLKVQSVADPTIVGWALDFAIQPLEPGEVCSP